MELSNVDQCAHKILRKQMSGMQVWYVCADWTPVSSLPDRLLTEFDGRFSDTLQLYDRFKNYWLGFYDFTDGEWWVHQGFADDKTAKLYEITHWRKLPSPPNGSECGQKFKAVEWDGKVKVTK